MDPLSEQTRALTPAASLNSLPAVERRLVALGCTLEGSVAPDLLDALDPSVRERIEPAVRGLATLPRSERLELLAREIVTRRDGSSTRRLRAALEGERAGVARLLSLAFASPGASPATPDSEKRGPPRAPLIGYVRRVGLRALE